MLKINIEKAVIEDEIEIRIKTNKVTFGKSMMADVDMFAS